MSTVGGFITARFSHLPNQGEQINIDDYLVIVKEADGRRIDRLLFNDSRPQTLQRREKPKTLTRPMLNFPSK